ncbi:hypothetical protein BDD12DRAFT_884365 [Trichophaea hybrida]|nr:hypothetical protein BDD12DRAFT_884365 [Trichophaea hybrida]
MPINTGTDQKYAGSKEKDGTVDEKWVSGEEYGDNEDSLISTGGFFEGQSEEQIV